MTTLSRSLQIVIAVLVIGLFGALAGWYFYLRSHHAIAAAPTGNAANVSFGNEAGQGQSGEPSGAGEPVSPSGAGALWKVDGEPVAGMHFVSIGSTTLLYYAERANGYVFQADPVSHQSARITDTLRPKIYEAYFANDGSVIERSIAENGSIATFLGNISKESDASSSYALSGDFLAPNALSIALNPATRGVFYLAPDGSGGVAGKTAAWDKVKPGQAFASALPSWRAYETSDGRLIAAESAADGIPGYAYQVNGSGWTELARGDGLTVAPSAASAGLLYGTSENGTLSLYLASSTPAYLAHTTADKCAWANGTLAFCAVPQGNVSKTFLDDWYQGLAHTSDSLIRINARSGTVTSVSGIDGMNVDVQNMTADPSGSYLAFLNGTDQSLWVLRVSQ